MLFNVLKRKCGCSCIFRASSRALVSRVSSCEARSSRSRESVAYCSIHVVPTMPQKVMKCVGKASGRSCRTPASWTAGTAGKPMSSG